MSNTEMKRSKDSVERVQGSHESHTALTLLLPCMWQSSHFPLVFFSFSFRGGFPAAGLKPSQGLYSGFSPNKSLQYGQVSGWPHLGEGVMKGQERKAVGFCLAVSGFWFQTENNIVFAWMEKTNG